MERPAECRNVSRGEQQVFWTHVWQSELRVGVEETAMKISAYPGHWHEICSTVSSAGHCTHEGLPLPLCLESRCAVRLHPVRRRSKKARARRPISVDGRRATALPAAVRGVRVKSPDVTRDNLRRHIKAVNEDRCGCGRVVGVLCQCVSCLVVAHSDV
ncbi:hypothetical protein MRX96_034784 [Rhipicephalus microplus]